MYNAKSLTACGGATFSSRFKKPLYGSYCFSRIPATVAHLLKGKSLNPLPVDVVGGQWGQYDTVILFLVDGFGWEFFEQFSEKYPFLKRFIQEGVVSKITSQFPSTTAAHITTLCTGLEVGQTGVYEWFYYEPLVDRMITPLCFSFAGDHEMGTLSKTNISPNKFFPNATIYQALKKEGVQSFVFQNASIAHTPYSDVLFSGAEIMPYETFQEGLKSLVDKLKVPGPKYLYFYFGEIDAKGHRQGIHSPQFLDTVDRFWKEMEESLWKSLKNSSQKVACLVTADHGMVPVDPEKTIYLNRLVPDITESFQKNREGLHLVPAGSCRDFFLHIHPQKLGEIQHQLQGLLQGVAEVYLTQDLLSQGFFGSCPSSPLLLNRIGNLVILPYVKESVWWFEKHRFEQHFKAAHGGLSSEEMESIFLFLET